MNFFKQPHQLKTAGNMRAGAFVSIRIWTTGVLSDGGEGLPAESSPNTKLTLARNRRNDGRPLVPRWVWKTLLSSSLCG